MSTKAPTRKLLAIALSRTSGHRQPCSPIALVARNVAPRHDGGSDTARVDVEPTELKDGARAPIGSFCSRRCLVGLLNSSRSRVLGPSAPGDQLGLERCDGPNSRNLAQIPSRTVMPRGRGPEHEHVRLPLVQQLSQLGWSDEQIQYEPEWRVPKNPSEASKRERGGSYEGYPVDIVLFDAAAEGDDWQRILVVFELKRPNRMEGKAQLETYLSLEPRARVGFWTNGTDRLALYRRRTAPSTKSRDTPIPRPDGQFLA